MDFRFTPEQERLRQEIRAWLAVELPPEWEIMDYDDEVSSDEAWAISRAFNKKLAQKGWIAPAWPKEYGGLGASYTEQLIFSEELAYRRAPVGANINRVGYAGPTIILYGTEEQKREHLPGITSAEVFWAQCFSEPNAGSDLASLQTRAVRDGDDYLITGQKIWTSGAHRADWAILLARTDPDAPKHRGISYFLVDMKSPGITVRPLLNLAGKHGFNEVFFDHVRVPARNRVGEENRGWYVATTTLDFERSSISGVAGHRRSFDELVQVLHAAGGVPAAARQALAETAIELDVARWLSYRVVSLQEQGKVPNYEASMAKLFSSEVGKRLANVAVHCVGVHGQLDERERRAPVGGRIAARYLRSAAMGIGGGTSEIQRNIIATRGLGLPRG